MIPCEKIKNEDKLTATVSGKITKVCQSSGCWIKVFQNEDKSMLVKFKDHFSIPKDVNGKEAFFIGHGEKSEITIAELKEIALKEGKSEEEISLITEPEYNITFYADGLYIK